MKYHRSALRNHLFTGMLLLLPTACATPTSSTHDHPTSQTTPETIKAVPPVATNTGFNHEMDKAEPGWEQRDSTNGNPFNNTFKSNHVSFSNGIMTLTVDNTTCPTYCDGKPYVSGEYRTGQENFGIGNRYEVRMRAAKGDGLVSSFFTYRGDYGTPTHDEIDFEVLGKDTTHVQINYYVEGHGGHEVQVPLGFDASQEFHTYAFELTDAYLAWSIDGKEVHRVTENPSTPEHELPYRPGKIMMNLWPGIGVDEWLKPFHYTGPITAEYDWVHVTPLGTSSPIANATSGTKAVQPSTSLAVLSVTKIGNQGDNVIALVSLNIGGIPNSVVSLRTVIHTDKDYVQNDQQDIPYTNQDQIQTKVYLWDGNANSDLKLIGLDANGKQVYESPAVSVPLPR